MTVGSNEVKGLMYDYSSEESRRVFLEGGALPGIVDRRWKTLKKNEALYRSLKTKYNEIGIEFTNGNSIFYKPTQ